MKRSERNEFNYIRRSLKGFTLGYGTTLTIRTDGSPEYKQALHEHYTSLGFHPASVRVDSRMAVLDGLLHGQPLGAGVLGCHNYVYIIPRADTVV